MRINDRAAAFATLLLLSLAAGGQASPPGRSAAGPTSRPEVTLDVSASQPDRVVAFGGSYVAVNYVGRPRTELVWQLGLWRVVVCQGRSGIGDDGACRFRFRLPDVSVPLRFTLVIRVGHDRLDRTIMVVPWRRLASAAGQIARLRIGVIDQAHSVQHALAAEGVAFEDLSSRLLQDAFTGQVVLIAGYEDPLWLTEACRRFQSRIDSGLVAVVLDPPVGWAAWGLSVATADPLGGGVVLGCSLDDVLTGAEMAGGGWRRALQVGPDSVILAWRERGVSRSALAATKSVGRGRVAVSVLWQKSDPLADTNDRAVLDAWLLWAVRENGITTKGVRS